MGCPIIMSLDCTGKGELPPVRKGKSGRVCKQCFNLSKLKGNLNPSTVLNKCTPILFQAIDRRSKAFTTQDHKDMKAFLGYNDKYLSTEGLKLKNEAKI